MLRARKIFFELAIKIAKNPNLPNNQIAEFYKNLDMDNSSYLDILFKYAKDKTDEITYNEFVKNINNKLNGIKISVEPIDTWYIPYTWGNKKKTIKFQDGSTFVYDMKDL